MKRGTSALIAASSRTVCVSTITSRNPCSADTTQDAHEHASVTWEALLKSTLAIVTPSSCSRSSLSRAVPWRTSALTLAPRSSKALTMRPPRLPVAPATTMVESFTIPILEKGKRRCKVGADLGGGSTGGFLGRWGQQTTGTPSSAVGTNLPPKRSESGYIPPRNRLA